MQVKVFRYYLQKNNVFSFLHFSLLPLATGNIYPSISKIVQHNPAIHSWTPPFIEGQGRTRKLGHWWGGLQKFLLEMGDKSEKGGGGGADVEMVGCHFFITLQVSHIYCVCWESKVPFITFRIFSLLS